MREKIVAGNWKMNTSLPEGIQLVKNILMDLGSIPKNVRLIVAPPFTHLHPVAQLLRDRKSTRLNSSH